MRTDQDVKFQAGDEWLSGRLVLADGSASKPQILFLHGAGKATKERCLPLASRLATEYGLSSFAFDFSGHGTSTGTLENSSLKKRVDEAIAALDYAGVTEQISLCAFSMGGHVALELVKLRRVRSLVLFYPAVYAREAVDIRFGDPRFSTILRSDKSWESSDVFAVLNQFEGSVLIVAGEKDQVIPPEVLKLLYANATRAKHRQYMVIPDAPHLLLPTVLSNEKLYSEICRIIADGILDGVEAPLAGTPRMIQPHTNFPE